MGRSTRGRGRSGRDQGRGENVGERNTLRMRNTKSIDMKRKKQGIEEQREEKREEKKKTVDSIMMDDNDWPLKTIESKEWNDAALIEIEVYNLRKSLVGMTNKEERTSVKILIE